MGDNSVKIHLNLAYPIENCVEEVKKMLETYWASSRKWVPYLWIFTVLHSL